MPRLRRLAPALVAPLLAWSAPAPSAAQTPLALVTDDRDSGTDVLLQAVSPGADGVVWVSGHGGTWGRSLDGGEHWTVGVVPGADTLQFRDVQGFDAQRAVLLAAGSGPLSRLFRTDDGGATWVETFVMDEPQGFLDCMAFVDDARGWAYGDAVDGVLYLLATTDGGRSWSRVPAASLPPALDSEGGFAASGACVAPAGRDGVVVATGNGPRPRLLRTRDGGGAWEVQDLPLTAGPAAGATAVGVGADGFAWAVGGAIGDPLEGPRVAVSTDGGATWTPGPGEPALEGPLYGGARAPGAPGPVLAAVGPGGVAWSGDGGATWTTLREESHWAVAFGDDGRGWAVGPRGRITLLRLEGREPDR